MPRKKTPTAEIVPASEAALVPSQKRESPQEMIERIVRERVDAIMVRLEAGHPEPEFMPRKQADEFHSQRNVFERRKWPMYFEEWGCKICSRKNVSHCGDGCGTPGRKGRGWEDHASPWMRAGLPRCAHRGAPGARFAESWV